MASHVRKGTHSLNVHGIKNGFFEWGCNMVFDNRISFSRASLILLFLPVSLPDIVSFVSPSMIMSMY